jgi:hypothetical protein
MKIFRKPDAMPKPSHIRVIQGDVPNQLSKVYPINRPINEAATIEIPRLDKNPKDLISWRLSSAIIIVYRIHLDFKPPLDSTWLFGCQPVFPKGSTPEKLKLKYTFMPHEGPDKTNPDRLFLPGY